MPSSAGIEKRLAEQPSPVNEELPPLDHATLEHLMRLLDEAHRFVDFLHKRLFSEQSSATDPAAEGAGENIFVVKDGILWEPELTSALTGITRSSVIGQSARSNTPTGSSYGWRPAIHRSPTRRR